MSRAGVISPVASVSSLDVPRVAALRWAVASLFLSAAFQLLCFIRWPGNPSQDVNHAVFAAQNLLAHGQLKSVNFLADYGADLAQYAKPHWLIHWPPGQAFLYAVVLGLGLSPGPATKALGFLGVLGGGLGWVLLARFLGASRNCMLAVAAAYPWLPFGVTAYVAYTNDHLALFIMPWTCLVLLRLTSVMEPSPGNSGGSSKEEWYRLWAAALIAILGAAVKYTLARVFAGASIYLFWRDRSRLRNLGILWGLGLLLLLLFPGLLYLLVNSAYGKRFALPVQPGAFSKAGFAMNLVNYTAAGAAGWDIVLAKAGALVDAHFHTHFPVAIVMLVPSFLMLIIWLPRLVLSGCGRLISFIMLLGILTAGLWAMLAASTWLSGLQWDFSEESRFYKPIVLLWLLPCALFLDRLPWKEVRRSVAFYSLALPVALVAIGEVRLGLLRETWLRLPQSGTAWIWTYETSHARFLPDFAARRSRKPDLLIGSDPRMMVELGVPIAYWRILQQRRAGYWTSKDLEIWAIIEADQVPALLEGVAGACSAERVAVPAGYPFAFYILNLKARDGPRTNCQRLGPHEALLLRSSHLKRSAVHHSKDH